MKTVSGESFNLVEDGSGEDKIVIFATDINIKILCEADTIYIDGTFQTAQSSFIKYLPYMHLNKVSNNH